LIALIVVGRSHNFSILIPKNDCVQWYSSAFISG